MHHFIVQIKKLVKKKIDARTSDAIAISIRNNCPIFTYEEILTNAGIIINSAKNFDKLSIDQNKKNHQKNKYLIFKHQEA